MYKRGYKQMLRDLRDTRKNICKYQRGLSIFEDQQMKTHLTSNTNAPLFQDKHLTYNLQKLMVGEAYLQIGPENGMTL
jgi:hypothetical protein